MCPKLKEVRLYRQTIADIVLAYVPAISKVYILTLEDARQVGDWVVVPDSLVEWTERSIQEETTPTDLVLLLTNACSLACTYCYADAGSSSVRMSHDTARLAVSFVARSAKDAGKSSFSVLFHGEGEPTMNWSVLCSTVEHARQVAKDLSLEARFSLATNGILTPEKREYLRQNMGNITVSIDGPAEVNDSARVFTDGSSSFSAAMESARFFYANRGNVNFGIRATLRPQHIQALPEIVRYFGRSFPGISLSVEPVDYVGRFSKKPRQSFEGLAFAYREARKVAQRYGLSFWYSAVRGPRRSGFFCGLAGRTVVIGPTGLLSGCSRASQAHHVGANEFIYGRLSPEQSTPEIDLGKKIQLEHATAANMSECNECIAFPWCRGDCPHIRLVTNGDLLSGVSSRCIEIRTIVMGELFDAAGFSETQKYQRRFYEMNTSFLTCQHRQASFEAPTSRCIETADHSVQEGRGSD